MKYFAVVVLIILLCAGLASATPSIPVVSLIGQDNATYTSTGASGSVGWFNFGMAPGQSWASYPNVSVNGGTITYTQQGMPLGINGDTYYVRACDITGCSAETSFQTATVTPIPTTTYGQYAQNITANGFSPTNNVWQALQPYTQITGATIFYGIILMALFVGLWLRTRGTQMALQLGMLLAVLFCGSVTGLALGLPPEFVAAGQAIMYVSLAGAIVSFTFR